MLDGRTAVGKKGADVIAIAQQIDQRVAHRPLDRLGRQAPGIWMIRSEPDHQTVGDVVAVANAGRALGGMARGQRLAGPIEQHPGKRAWDGGIGCAAPLNALSIELLLDPKRRHKIRDIPKRGIDHTSDRRGAVRAKR